jgi:hypothetical protein
MNPPLYAQRPEGLQTLPLMGLVGPRQVGKTSMAQISVDLGDVGASAGARIAVCVAATNATEISGNCSGFRSADQEV